MTNTKSNQNLEYASFGMRLGALLIDIVLVIFILMFIFPKVIRQVSKIDFDIDKDLSGTLMISIILFFIIGIPFIGILYRSFFECSKLQGTPGKIILGIKVVDFNYNRISFKKSFLRNIIKNVSGLMLYIGYLVALGDKKCLTWHDSIAKTYVIRELKSNIIIRK